MNKKIKWVLVWWIVAVLIAAMLPWTLSSSALRRELASASAGRPIGFTTECQGTIYLRVIFRDPGSSSRRCHVQRLRWRLFTPGRCRQGRAAYSTAPNGSPGTLFDNACFGRYVGRSRQAAPYRRLHRGSNSPGAVASSGRRSATKLGIVSIVSGTAHFTSDTRRYQADVENINATLDWRRLTSPATLNGTVNWRGTDADIALWINKPAALLRGNTSPVDLKIDSIAGSLTMDGTLAGRPSLQYEGRVAAYAPLLREAMQLFNISVPLPGPLRDARLTAQARVESNAMTLSDTHISLDGNAFEGSLAMHKDQGRPVWSGTLATDLFALSPFLSDQLPALTPDGQWSREPIDTANLDFGDLDLRLSASRAHFGRVLLENAGFSILLNWRKARDHAGGRQSLWRNAKGTRQCQPRTRRPRSAAHSELLASR